MAGISYQLFGYELKCSDKIYCNWTNWFEIYYNLSTVAGAGTLLVAVAYSCFDKKNIKVIKITSPIIVFIYSILCLTGAILPNKFLISYEFLVLFSVPIYIAMLIINCYQYIMFKKMIYKYYMILWLLLFTIA